MDIQFRAQINYERALEPKNNKLFSFFAKKRGSHLYFPQSAHTQFFFHFLNFFWKVGLAEKEGFLGEICKDMVGVDSFDSVFGGYSTVIRSCLLYTSDAADE